MKMNTRIAKGVAVLALASLAVVPLSAWAVPGNGKGHTPKSNASKSAAATAKKAGKAAPNGQAAKMQNLRDRIAKVLANRDRAFNNAASHISGRIDAASALASTVASAGGDVAAVLSQLDAARAALSAAMTAEATAIDMFKAVPDATNRKAAFTAAKAQAKTARIGLSDARSLLRNALLALEVVVNGLAPVTP